MNARARIRSLLLRGAGRLLATRQTAPPTAGRQPRILLIRPDHLGDLLFVAPALDRLRAALPDAWVSVAAGPWNADLLDGLPGVDERLLLDFPGFTRRPKSGPLAPYRYLREVARDLARRRFDAAVVLRDDHWWGALLAASAGIPVRVGYGLPDVAPFLSVALPPPAEEHAVTSNVRLVAALLTALGAVAPTATLTPTNAPLHFTIADADHRRATALLAPLADAGPLVAIHASSGVPVKLWVEERWAAVAERLIAATGARLVLTGGPDDRALTAAVAGPLSAPALDLAGQTSIGALAAVLARCDLVLGPDSGALHLAVAVGTPTVHLFGPASVVKFGPWGPADRHRVVSAGPRCARCGDLSPSRPRGAACMLAIGVEEVVAAALALLEHRTLVERRR